MKLDEFIELTEKELARFEEYYRNARAKAGAKGEEDHWPLVMNEVDWFEQFVAWQTMGQPTS